MSGSHERLALVDGAREHAEAWAQEALTHP